MANSEPMPWVPGPTVLVPKVFIMPSQGWNRSLPAGLRVAFLVARDEMNWLEAEVGFIPCSFLVLSECPHMGKMLNSATFEPQKGLIQ